MKLSRCHQTYCGDHRNMGTAHPTGPKCPHSKVTGWYIHKCPKVKTFAISSELLIGVRALKLFSKQKHMWTYREEMDSGTWPAPVQMCTLGDMPSKASSQLSLASLISHLPQTLWGRAGSCGFCYAFVLSNLICFVFCCVPLERVKMLPHCGRTVLLYALTVMRQPGRLKRSHPVPYPRWREKKKNKKQKNAQTELGLFTSPGWSQAWRGFPFSGAVWCLDFEDLYQKWEKQCYWKVGEGSSCFLNTCKNGQIDTSAFSGLKGWITSLMAPVCLVLDSGHLLNLGWARGEKQTLGVSHFPIDSKEGTDSKLFMQPPAESSEAVKSVASHGDVSSLKTKAFISSKKRDKI